MDGKDPLPRYESLARAKRNRLVVADKVFVGWNQKLIEQGNYFYAFSHIPLYSLKLPPMTFTVTCFRDPFQRLFSHYRMLKNFKLKNVAHPCMQEEGQWLGNGFKDFLRLIPREHLLCQLYNFSPNLDVKEAVKALASVNQIIFTEKFEEGIESMNQKTGLNLKPRHVRKNEFTEIIAPTLVETAHEMLEDEYKLMKQIKDPTKNS